MKNKFENYTKAWKQDKIKKLKAKRDKMTKDIDGDIFELEHGFRKDDKNITWFEMTSPEPTVIVFDR